MDDVFSTIAYHKNSYETAQKNVRWQSFFVSRDKDDKIMWLGDGIYFWENLNDALWWRGNYGNEAMLSALLSCGGDDFVNLDDPDTKKEFDEFCRRTKLEMEKQKSFDFPDSGDDGIAVLSFFCNVFKELYNIQLLKYSFPKINGRPQYCATDSSIVSDIRIVARSVGNRFEWY